MDSFFMSKKQTFNPVERVCDMGVFYCNLLKKIKKNRKKI